MCTVILCPVSSDGYKKAGPHEEPRLGGFGYSWTAASSAGLHRQPSKADSLEWRIISSWDTALTMDSTDLLVASSTSGGDVFQGHHLLDLLTLGVEDVGQSGFLEGHRLNDVGDRPGYGWCCWR